MKAITLHQPYASLAALGLKRYETRSWAASYTGPIVIHSGMWQPGPRAAHRAGAYDAAVISPAILGPLFPDKRVSEMDADERRGLLLTPPFGAVLATAQLVEALAIKVEPGASAPSLIDRDGNVREVSAAEVQFGHYQTGRWAWVLAEVQPLREPVPARGRLGIWEWVAT